MLSLLEEVVGAGVASLSESPFGEGCKVGAVVFSPTLGGEVGTITGALGDVKLKFGSMVGEVSTGGTTLL